MNAPQSATALGPLVVPVHVAVPGRARLGVAGLYRNEALKHALELELSHREGIQSACANPLTGNILVLFDLRLPRGRVEGWIEDAVRAFIARKRARRLASQAETSTLVPLRQARRSTPWHVRTADEVAAHLQTSLSTGLSPEEAESRLARFGPNRLPAVVPRSRLRIFLEQFNTLPVALLGVSAVLSLLTGGLFEAAAIAGIVAINGVIGYFTESDADRAISALSEEAPSVALVTRAGRRIEVAGDQLVPGDLLELRPGMVIAADARLTSATRLMVDESALTGESMPVAKTVAPLDDRDAALAERANLAFMGTSVASGRGRAIVVATGKATELGLISRLVGEVRPPGTPLQAQLDVLGNRLVLTSAAICGLVFVLGTLRGYGLLPMLRSSIALAIAAVPEGLPTVATTALALGIGAMRRNRVLIRQLRAVETLGALQVVCFDKTGTITFNRMSVAAISAGDRRLRLGSDAGQDQDSQELVQLLEAAVLCNEAELRKSRSGQKILGSPTEAALVRLALDHGIDVEALRRRHPMIEMADRAERQQFMKTVHVGEKGRLIAVKGSPRAVMDLCACQVIDGQCRPLSDANRAALVAENDTMAGEGLRVLGVACGTSAEGAAKAGALCWLGLVGMTDPVRGGMEDLIAAFQGAGIRTVMITGDQRATAEAVARQLGLNGAVPLKVVDASGLAGKSVDELAEVARGATVFARVSPRRKLEIVRVFQSAGQVTAMTGDGINDGPALKAADIGVAMGRGGTDLARQVADVVLEDDNLETLLEAVRRGRTVHSNIRRSIQYILATNLSEIMVVFAATAAGLGEPLQPLQLLWINLISDSLPCIALAVEPPDPDVLEHPPRDPAAPIIGAHDLPRMLREGAVMGAGALGGYGYGLWRYGAGPRASTIAFSTLITAQMLHAWTARSEHYGLFRPGARAPNRYLDSAVLGSLVLQIAATFVPGLRRVLGITPLGFLDAAVVGAGAGTAFLTNELVKLGGPIEGLSSSRRVPRARENVSRHES